MYKVHCFEIRMTKDYEELEKFLISLLGDIVAIIPTRLALINLSLRMEEFILIVERVK
jgi:hypothetical protein